MENEQTSKVNNTESAGGISLTEILFVLRAHWIMIVVIAVAFILGGVVYSKVRKPVYTASVPVIFTMRVMDNGGEQDQVTSTNYLLSFLKTAPKYCQGDKIIALANVYYDYYLKSHKDLDVFIDDLKAAYAAIKDDPTKTDIAGYEVTDALIEANYNKYITKSMTSVSYKYDDSTPTAVMRLSVRNLNSQYAREMVRIFAFTVNFSINKEPFKDKATAEYIELATDSSGVAVSSDMSPKRIVTISAVLGIVVAVLVVFLKRLSDNTLRDKEVLENITGAPVIAYIDDIAGVK